MPGMAFAAGGSHPGPRYRSFQHYQYGNIPFAFEGKRTLMEAPLNLFATAPRGLESLLAEELRSLGGAEVRETRAGVLFQGALREAYRICLWSRLASRVLLHLAEFEAAGAEELYDGVRAMPWERHLADDGTLAVDATVRNSALTHSRFAALKVKDAIVDRFRDQTGRRPGIDVERPQVRINLHLDRNRAQLSLDLSGDSLHRRGYRREGLAAPLKENLAAAILVRSGWPELAAAGGTLLDPMCGSGTLPIEGALLAADCAPGLLREYWGFNGWLGHRPDLWQELLEEARQRCRAGLERLPAILGYDSDPRAVQAARDHAQRAGLGNRLTFEVRPLEQLQAPDRHPGNGGLVVANPPYGERLGEMAELRGLYALLGERLRQHFLGWQAAVFTGNPELAKNLGLRAHKLHPFFNGALACRLLRFQVEPQWFFGANAPQAPLSEGARMFANRLRKNMRTLQRWAQQENVTCYRLYDADMPEYALAVDRYEDRLHVQEYQAPATVDAAAAARRLREALRVLPEVLEVSPEAVAVKVRQRQKGTSQYDRQAGAGERFVVREGNCRFWVNLHDYLDTGLFLDHRPTRFLLQELAAGRRFLNLFGYTGTATVHAARGGAGSTLTVDLSRTYLDWARDNLALNGLAGPQHRLLQADVLQFLERDRGRYDLIFLDPPTFSNSKSMSGTLDIQRDHVRLLRLAAALLAPDGILIFSNNFRKFRMDREGLPELSIEDITAATIPPDFTRNPRIHNCWRITRR